MNTLQVANIAAMSCEKLGLDYWQVGSDGTHSGIILHSAYVASKGDTDSIAFRANFECLYSPVLARREATGRNQAIVCDYVLCRKG